MKLEAAASAVASVGGSTHMSFDVDKLIEYCEAALEAFAKDHQDETFYAFAIDADMLCLNSLEQFEITLKEYQDRWDRRTRPIGSPT